MGADENDGGAGTDAYDDAGVHVDEGGTQVSDHEDDDDDDDDEEDDEAAYDAGAGGYDAGAVTVFEDTTVALAPVDHTTMLALYPGFTVTTQNSAPPAPTA